MPGAGLIASVVTPITSWTRNVKQHRDYSGRSTDPDTEEQGISRRPLLHIQTSSPSASSRDSAFSTVTASRQQFSPFVSAYFGDSDEGGGFYASPESLRRDPAGALSRVPEEGAMEFEHEDSDGPRYTGGVPFDQNSDDEDWELEEQLAGEGLYPGSYQHLVWLYTFVPATLVVSITILAILPSILYRSQSPSPYPYAPYFPSPLPELLAAVSLWSLAHLLRSPSYSLALYISSPFPAISTAFSTIFTTITHVFLTTLFQQISLPLLLIPQHMVHEFPTWGDPAFARVWWLALGWAAAESVVAVKQGYEGIALYRDVLVTVQKLDPRDAGKDMPTPSGRFYGATENSSLPLLRTADDAPGRAGAAGASRQNSDSDLGERESLILRRVAGTRKPLPLGLEDQVEHNMDQLLCLKNREELEEVYGMPFIRIPVFISCLERINCLLLSLGFYLLLSAAYLRSTLGAPHPYPASNVAYIVTLPLIIVIQLFLAALHALPILPRIGVHTAVYVGLLVSLGTFFAGLGVWEALS